MLDHSEIDTAHPTEKVAVIGGSHIALFAIYYAHQAAKARGVKLKAVVYEKNQHLEDTTVMNLAPSLALDELLSVLPIGRAFIDKRRLPFNRGGVSVDDVALINDSEADLEFQHAVEQYGLDIDGHAQRTQVLLEFGKMCMESWEEFYQNADAKLKQILIDSNYNPCRERSADKPRILRDGYRLDPIAKTPNAAQKAESMAVLYRQFGYKDSAALSPEEALRLDPYLSVFCDNNTEIIDGIHVWRNDAAVVWRPGGCINTRKFLPLFINYLTEVMGTYVNEAGITKNCFRYRLQRHVEQVAYDETALAPKINGLKFWDRPAIKRNKPYSQVNYLFCPGENVGTLKHLGFAEPESARFAGASLRFTYPLTAEQCAIYADYHHYMEVHRDDIVIAWQGECTDGQISIRVAGTKAYYADIAPDKNEAFALDRNLLQLNIINELMPQFITLALSRETQGITLTANDMAELERRGMLTRWVGSRACAFDGFPTGPDLYTQAGEKTENGSCITHLGSGGVSCGPGMVRASHARMFKTSEEKTNKLIEQLHTYADSRRTFR